MFIATRLPLIISAKSEMLSISLFAEEVRRPCALYKHYVPRARFRLDSFERLLLRQSHEVTQLQIDLKRAPESYGSNGRSSTPRCQVLRRSIHCCRRSHGLPVACGVSHVEPSANKTH